MKSILRAPVFKRFLCLCLSVWLVSAGTSVAAAQSKSGVEKFGDRREAARKIEDRTPEALRAERLHFKGFSYQSALSLETVYNSNILADESGEKSDYITAIKPLLTVEKVYDGHLFYLDADANIERYATRSEEDKEEFRISGGGEFDLNSRWSFPFRVYLIRDKRSRDTPTDAQRTTSPLAIKKAGLSAGVNRKFNRLTIGLLGRYRDVSYEDSAAEQTGAPIVFSDQDRQEFGATLSAGYELKNDHTLFADLSYRRLNFDRLEFDGTSFSGSSGDRDEVTFLTGFQTEYKDFLYARLGVGVLHQNFDDNFDSTTNFNFKADVAYNFFPKYTFNLNAERLISQDNGFTNGVTETLYEAGLDYEIRHNMLVETLLQYQTFEFETTGREEKDTSGGINIRYIHSPYLQTVLGITHEQRNSNQIDSDFDRTIYLLRLTGQL